MFHASAQRRQATAGIAMKTLTKSAVCAVYKYSGAMNAQEQLGYWSGRRCMSIALFHRVTDAIPEDGLTVSTTWFRGFCELMRSQFHVISVAEMHRILENEETPPRRTIAITFDDSYRDNLFAARVLAEHQMPATFFVPTKYVSTDHVFAWDHDLPRMANLTWADIHELVQMGHEIGSHTVSHPDLGRLGPKEARRELGDSKKTLEDRLQRPIRWLAYPFGRAQQLSARISAARLRTWLHGRLLRVWRLRATAHARRDFAARGDAAVSLAVESGAAPGGLSRLVLSTQAQCRRDLIRGADIPRAGQSLTSIYVLV